MPDLLRPQYRVPSMGEIAALAPNGRRVLSTFSGCGGSCLGYRMAGYKVIWANEFVPAAQDVYRANHPDSILSTADIRTLDGATVLAEAGLSEGELDLFDGSPPCASFSTAGKREKGWGETKKYSDTEQRSDDLFFEYIRLLRALRPKVFVAENVSGLVKGKAKGYFKQILAEMKASGYRVEARLLNAKWLGVPQNRERLIFVGVRNDLVSTYGVGPAFPDPLPYTYSIRDAIPHLTALEGGRSANFEQKGAPLDVDRAIPTIGAGSKGNGSHQFYVTGVSTSKGIRSLDEPSPTILTHGREGTQSELVLAGVAGDGTFTDPETGDTISLGNAVGREWDRLNEGEQSERYFQLVRPHRDNAVGTVTASGGNVGLASVTHPTEKRKFTLGELRRLSGFPDDFALSGTYSQRWERLGRAVPPVMAAAVGRSIFDHILSRLPE